MRTKHLLSLLAAAIAAGTATAQTHQSSSHFSSRGGTNFSVSITSVNGTTVVHRSSGSPGASVSITTNGGVMVFTSVITNGGAMAMPAMGHPLDPQAILKALKAGGAGPAFAGWNFAEPNADTNPVTWLGVATEPASADLRAQLPLPAGAGLIVREVVADSPAATAGLRVNDILIRFEDQLLINTEQFQALIAGKDEGDEVSLTVLRKGQETKVRAKLVKKAPAEVSDATQPVPGLPIADLFKAAGGPGDLQGALDDAMKTALEQMKSSLGDAQK
jgi:S1-C subfamily serine protease